MKPIEFKGQNCVFAKDQPEYQPLPALKIDSSEAEVITCWELSFWEKIRVMWTGRIWLSLMSFNRPLTPTFMSTRRKDVFILPEDMAKVVEG